MHLIERSGNKKSCYLVLPKQMSALRWILFLASKLSQMSAWSLRWCVHREWFVSCKWRLRTPSAYWLFGVQRIIPRSQSVPVASESKKSPGKGKSAIQLIDSILEEYVVSQEIADAELSIKELNLNDARKTDVVSQAVSLGLEGKPVNFAVNCNESGCDWQA